jgi:hypothetical protein
MNKFVTIILLSLLLASVNASAAVTCTGTIDQIYKWNSMERVSIMLSSTNKWINMPTKTDEAMAMMAFAASKPVYLYWAAADVTACQDGWEHNRSLEGYWVIMK